MDWLNPALMARFTSLRNAESAAAVKKIAEAIKDKHPEAAKQALDQLSPK